MSALSAKIPRYPVIDNPSTRMFWKDLDEEKTLRMCSMAARGLWSTHMLPIMAQGGGYLAFDGRPLSMKQLAALVGYPLADVQGWIAELGENHVFSRDRFETPYNRRMVKAEKKAEIVRKNGKTGGRPPILKTKANSDLLTKTEPNPKPKPNQNSQPRARGSSSPISPLSPEGKNHDADTSASARSPSPWIPVGDRVLDIIGVRDDPRWFGNYSLVQMWMKQGFDPDVDIYPTVTAVMAKRNGQGPPANLKYFDRAIAQAFADRMRPPPEVSANGTGHHSGKPPKPTQESDRAIIAAAIRRRFGPVAADAGGTGDIIDGKFRRGD